MAICNLCGKVVSVHAPVCPNCGQPDPTFYPGCLTIIWDFIKPFVFYIVIAFIFSIFFSMKKNKSNSNEASPTNSNYSQTNLTPVTNFQDKQPLPVVSSTEHRHRVIGSQELNVRNGSNDIVGKVYLGDVLVTYEQIDGWTRIGQNQWVKSKYLEPL